MVISLEEVRHIGGGEGVVVTSLNVVVTPFEGGEGVVVTSLEGSEGVVIITPVLLWGGGGRGVEQ